MDPRTVLEDSVVEVSKRRYAVVTTGSDVEGTFATIDDGRELTHVVSEERLTDLQPIDAEPGWRVLTFDVVLPFDLVGFLAVVASALADAGVSIFALSAYSTDHVLVAERDLQTALETLSELGCSVRDPRGD
jgi:hypothetical protein